jgi:predicted hydrocarbon binding protein
MQGRFTLQYKADEHRRLIGGKETIIHCHHYNARLQHTIEHVTEVDGAKIIRDSAEAVFAEYVANVIDEADDEDARIELVAALYAHLGFGRLDVSRAKDGIVTADQSHYVEGWRAGFAETKRKACTFTEGYLQGGLRAATGKLVAVREHKCLNAGDDHCEFVVEARSAPPVENRKQSFQLRPDEPDSDAGQTSNVDEQAIIDAIVQMPIMGSEEGLIPAFGVYLALTPADFYNLMCIQFVEQMRAKGLFQTARRLLTFAGETCAMNTFRGIMASAEWDALIAPMIQQKQDNLFGLVALSNGFGWGNWRVTDHQPAETLTIQSLNGYEAIGYREYRGPCESPQCFMLCGVSAGLMELVYGDGTIEERFGTYLSEESSCICAESSRCRFDVEAT